MASSGCLANACRRDMHARLQGAASWQTSVLEVSRIWMAIACQSLLQVAMPLTVENLANCLLRIVRGRVGCCDPARPKRCVPAVLKYTIRSICAAAWRQQCVTHSISKL